MDGTGLVKKDWKKEEKALYLPGQTPVRIQVPEMAFFVLAGRGSPDRPEFGDEVGALYALSYGIKMMPKRGPAPAGYYDYPVFPLEGVWDFAEDARPATGSGEPHPFDKSAFQYEIMIRQPDFVTEALAEEILHRSMPKIAMRVHGRIRFEKREEGDCVQLLHVGPYDTEPASFQRMAACCRAEGLERLSMRHREIYLSDPGRTAPEKCRTVLRIQVRPVR